MSSDAIPLDDRKGAKQPDEKSPFKQQTLRAWRPLLTPKAVILIFLGIFCIFIPIGIAVLVASNDVVEVKVRYDNMDDCVRNTTCTVTIGISSQMPRPVYVYYELTNFYQNHRRYVKSRADNQLRGDLDSSTSTCSPLESSGGKILVPCGLIANSFFNDTFTAKYCDASSTCTTLANRNWDSSSIAWSTDVDEKFKAASIDPSKFTQTAADGHQLPTVTDPDFIVWMRTAGLPTFKKLYRVIKDTSLEAGSQLTVTVKNNYKVASFNGEKRIVVSTTSWLGGKNAFLGWAYISVAILSICMAGFFFAKLWCPRAPGSLPPTAAE